jgi:hypothetical protein
MQEFNNPNRLGFHYYPDSLHYREKDKNLLLPRMRNLGASWITLRSHWERAIPEPFIRALLDNDITPIVHIPMLVKPFSDLHNLRVLFRAYANWGIKYLVLFDRPNQKKMWGASIWSQRDLVERFLDFYLPAAEASHQEGLIPVFPPLEPGGDYWDTVFLQSALQGIVRRGNFEFIGSLSLGAYGWTFGRDIFWGKGGPLQWPEPRPYFTPHNSQDQLGFFLFDWYLGIARSIMGHEPPIYVLASGCRKEDIPKGERCKADHRLHEQTNIQLYNLIQKSQQVKHIFPESLKACNLWLLSASGDDPEKEVAWFPEGKPANPIVELVAKQTLQHQASKSASNFSPIGHYLLIPEISWAAKDWLYQLAKPVIDSRNLQWGPSLDNALNARRVTIVGDSRWLSEEYFTLFSSAGCVIEEIYGDGITIATRLLNL